MTELDLTKMKWDVSVKGDILSVYPDLKNIFLEHIEKIESLNISVDKFVRFAVLCYCKDSPLVPMIDDLLVRKKKALSMINADIPELLETLENQTIAHAILQLLKFENHSRHMSLMMYQETRCKYQFDLINAKAAGIKNTREGIEWVEAQIEKLSQEHFKGDKELENFSGSFGVLENRKIFPEEQ